MQELSTALGEDAKRESTKERDYYINSPSGGIPPKEKDNYRKIIIISRAHARRTRFRSTPKATRSRSLCAHFTVQRPTDAFGDGTHR